MNRKECANCLVHGWTQPEETGLLQCKNCQFIFYCSEECQGEHWVMVHKDHCKYFADPSLNEPWEHKEKDCIICLKAAVIGESIVLVDNPNYDCILKTPFPPTLVHPHPFPIKGQPGDIREKAIIVLMQLVRKFQVTHIDVAWECREEFLALRITLGGERIGIWRVRKIYPQPQAQLYRSSILEDLTAIESKFARMEILQDAFQLWQIIGLIERIIQSVRLNNQSRFLKDPLTNLPNRIKKLILQSIENAPKYLAMAEKILEALTHQVIPYEEVLKIVGGGNLKQECSFCFREIDISSEDCSIYFTPLLLGTYSCGSEACEEKGDAGRDDQNKLEVVLAIMWMERVANNCDFCFQKTPVKQVGSEMRDIHRCSNCFTVMYCSEDCLYQDDGVHVKACQRDKEGRKKKPRGSLRRRMAKEKIQSTIVDILLFNKVNDGGTCSSSGRPKQYEIKFKVNQNALFVFDIDKQMTDFHENCPDHKNHSSQYGVISWEPENGQKEEAEDHRINGAKFYAEANVKIALGITMLCDGFGVHDFNTFHDFPRNGKFTGEDFEVEVIEVNGKGYEDVLKELEYESIPLAVLSFLPLTQGI